MVQNLKPFCATGLRPLSAETVQRARCVIRRSSMNISDLLAPDAVIASLKVSSKKQLLQELAARAAQISGIPERKIFETLNERERLGSTGVGQGIAIPHGRLADIKTIVGVFARLETPIDYDAVDKQPVDLVFMLLAPEGAGADHLKALARVSRLLRNQAACEKLRAATKAEALYAILTEPTAQRERAGGIASPIAIVIAQKDRRHH